MSQYLPLYYLLFGVLTIVGGVIGFVKAKSKPSLIAGGISGVLLLVAYYLLSSGSFKAGVILGLVISLLLAGRFVPAFLKTRALMPAGLMSVLSVVGIILSVLALI